jgi:hypothetical protein
MANVPPRDLVVAAKSVGEAIERVSRQAVHAPDAGRLERLDDDIGECPGL